MDYGTLEKVNGGTVREGTRIFNFRFISELKKAVKRLRLMSILIEQIYCSEWAACIATKSPKIQRFTQRVIMSVADSEKKTHLYTKYITQSYVHSRTELERTVYMQLLPEMGLPDDVVLKAVKAFYEIPESGLHWYLN